MPSSLMDQEAARAAGDEPPHQTRASRRPRRRKTVLAVIVAVALAATSVAVLTREPSGDDGQRLGLHVTAPELTEWRLRADRGPYRVQGDAATNSPGDWDRISDNAARFMDDPAAGRWAGPVENNPGGCVQRDGGSRANDLGWQPPVQAATDLRDAAFYALIQRSPAHARAVKDELLAQLGEPGVAFGDAERWCPGRILDGSPGFMIATWLTKLLYAADYVEALDPELFTEGERQAFDRWLVHAAALMRHDTDQKLDELFHDREGGDYGLRPLAYSKSGDRRPVFLDGPPTHTLHRRFNNRNARQARFVTLVGLRVGDDDFVEHGKAYVRDALRFSYFPIGAVGDFERWTADDPTLGWKYGVEFAGALITIADHLARHGDSSLYRFSTTDGALGTAGARPDGSPKSLEGLVEDLLRYVDHTYRRYGTDRQRRAGDDDYLIDSVNELADDARINDIQLVQAAGWFDDPYIDAVITRRQPGAPPYPANPRQGAGDAEGGEGGVYPGVLFMFHVDDDIDPYPG